MILAYGEGPRVAVFAGSWHCSKSPVDGALIALGEPVGDCADPAAVSRLSSIATAVHLLKSLGIKVFFAGSGEDALAAFAGGADGLLSDLKYREGAPDSPDDSAFILIKAKTPEEVRRAVRLAGEIYKRRVEVLVAGGFEELKALGPYASAVVLESAPPLVKLESASHLPEIGRCGHCGVDFLMYGARITRCAYCGRRLLKVLTEKRPPQRPEVLRSAHKRLSAYEPLRIVVV
ncbi:MAG: hypothetical protein JZD41_05585 [Thermoproteus sp.]|nr:hypothetical protein [Thermoproteus sp.]